MKALCIHAHYDDFEFTCAGTFLQWQRQLGGAFRGRFIVCTDGAGGHHFRSRSETARLRLAEQEAAASLGGFEFELLRLPDGSVPREGCLDLGSPLLAALWKAIRDFEPDYLFCPPIPADPLAGVHLDHEAVAHAVRKVAYLINVPHLFTPEYPADESQSTPCRVPVILNVHDGYLTGGAHDFAVEVEESFATIAGMTWCHQSQIREWLPWVGRHDLPVANSPGEWNGILRRRFEQVNRRAGFATDRALEHFTVTAWGGVPTVAQFRRDFPSLSETASHWERLATRLKAWQD